MTSRWWFGLLCVVVYPSASASRHAIDISREVQLVNHTDGIQNTEKENA
jgi:hypothetical protein